MVGLIKKILAIGIVLGLSTGAQAQTADQQSRAGTESSFSTALDCTIIEIKINEPDQPLTAAERAALMDKAFYESLSRFDRCQAAQLSSSAANSGQSAAGAGTGGGDGSAGGGAGTGTVESVASQSLQGTMTEEKVETDAIQSIASQSVTGTLPKQAEEKVETDAIQSTASQSVTGTLPKQIDVSALGSGKLPEDSLGVFQDDLHPIRFSNGIKKGFVLVKLLKKIIFHGFPIRPPNYGPQCYQTDPHPIPLPDRHYDPSDYRKDAYPSPKIYCGPLPPAE